MRHFINADQPANPTVHTNAHLNGLTKREQFAAMAMQGLCANSIVGKHHLPENLAVEAVTCADALLKALENDK